MILYPIIFLYLLLLNTQQYLLFPFSTDIYLGCFVAFENKSGFAVGERQYFCYLVEWHDVFSVDLDEA